MLDANRIEPYAQADRAFSRLQKEHALKKKAALKALLEEQMRAGARRHFVQPMSNVERRCAALRRESLGVAAQRKLGCSVILGRRAMVCMPLMHASEGGLTGCTTQWQKPHTHVRGMRNRLLTPNRRCGAANALLRSCRLNKRLLEKAHACKI